MTRKCRVCRNEFVPQKPMATVCSHECALTLAASKRAKAEKVASVKAKKADSEKRKAIKSRAQWLKEAQAAFNAFIRLRDHDLACISCGRHHQGQYHAGHYRSVGAAPELRFSEQNVHKQCAPCNTHLSGNITRYRGGLLKKLGSDVVLWLEGHHEAKHYTIQQLEAIKLEYTALAREIKKGMQ